MPVTPKNLPYGLWQSPITPLMLGQRLRLEDIQWDSDGRTLVWLEGRSDRGVLVARPEDEARRDLTDAQSVRGTVGYGGGEFTASNGLIFFAESNGRLYRCNLAAGHPVPITPPFGSAAAPAVSPDGKWVVYVFSDGHTDLLGLVDSHGLDWPVQLARGADFYMQPTWHPQGELLAWIEWKHPNMPWDGTTLKLGRLAGSSGLAPRLVEENIITGGSSTPVAQPCFSPDGRWLSFIESSGEWENLVILDLQNGTRRTLASGDQFLLTTPAWVQGVHTYGWNYTSQKIFYLRNFAGFASMWVVDLENGRSNQIDTIPYTWLAQLSVSPTQDQIALIGSAPGVPERMLRWDGLRWHIENRSEPENISPDWLPIPHEISWKAPDGTPVHGLYYAPRNPDCTCQGLPPAILHIHGGPTSQETASYSAETAYFTSRGYGWLEVNYRGSSGYGLSYQNALRQKWGLLDREDAAGGAQALIDQGLADGKNLVIMGGSAGGYTVLNALIHYPGLFKAGICRYGVSNLFNLAMDTHKFEERYTDSMVGPLPEAAERYQAWSPIYHADQIRDALAIFQGDSDRVVTPNQSEEIVAILRQRGVPHIYRLYPGEGHGFRKNETIVDYLQQVERFLIQNLIFAP